MTEQNPAAATTTTAAAADATSGADTTAITQSDSATPATNATDAKAPVSGETKPEGDKATEQPAQAPEKYELAVPEGLTLEPETTTAFENVARELNLTNDQANKLVPLAAQLVQRNLVLQQEAHAKQVTQWLEDAKADPEMGAAKFDETVKVAKSAVERFGTPPLKTLMDQTGLGNHPEIIRLFHRIGSAIADDKFVVAPSSGGTKSAASVLFDHPTSQR